MFHLGVAEAVGFGRANGAWPRFLPERVGLLCLCVGVAGEQVPAKGVHAPQPAQVDRFSQAEKSNTAESLR